MSSGERKRRRKQSPDAAKSKSIESTAHSDVSTTNTTHENQDEVASTAITDPLPPGIDLCQCKPSCCSQFLFSFDISSKIVLSNVFHIARRRVKTRFTYHAKVTPRRSWHAPNRSYCIRMCASESIRLLSLVLAPPWPPLSTSRSALSTRLRRKSSSMWSPLRARHRCMMTMSHWSRACRHSRAHDTMVLCESISLVDLLLL
jgi:hypothetical protein